MANQLYENAGALFLNNNALAEIESFDVDHDAKVRFHSGNVTGWSSLPVRFTPAG